MAKVHAPFPITRTIRDLTFYMMGGVNYVRTKSTLTRKRVLKNPAFRKTRFYAGLMAQASKIGSVIYQALPPCWRQGWMYRAFTGEALQLLKDGETVEEATRLLWARYVEAINHHGEDLTGRLEAAVKFAAITPKGTRKRKDPRVERLRPYSDLLVQASKVASELYSSLPVEKRKFVIYQALVSEAMRLLKAEHNAPESQSPVKRFPSAYEDVVGQSLCTSKDALLQGPGSTTQKVLATNRSVKKVIKLNKSRVKASLFWIPTVNVSSGRCFARRRTHGFCLVGRSP